MRLERPGALSDAPAVRVPGSASHAGHPALAVVGETRIFKSNTSNSFMLTRHVKFGSLVDLCLPMCQKRCLGSWRTPEVLSAKQSEMLRPHSTYKPLCAFFWSAELTGEQTMRHRSVCVLHILFYARNGA